MVVSPYTVYNIILVARSKCQLAFRGLSIAENLEVKTTGEGEGEGVNGSKTAGLGPGITSGEQVRVP